MVVETHGRIEEAVEQEPIVYWTKYFEDEDLLQVRASGLKTHLGVKFSASLTNNPDRIGFDVVQLDPTGRFGYDDYRVFIDRGSDDFFAAGRIVSEANGKLVWFNLEHENGVDTVSTIRNGSPATFPMDVAESVLARFNDLTPKGMHIMERVWRTVNPNSQLVNQVGDF